MLAAHALLEWRDDLDGPRVKAGRERDAIDDLLVTDDPDASPEPPVPDDPEPPADPAPPIAAVPVPVRFRSRDDWLHYLEAH